MMKKIFQIMIAILLLINCLIGCNKNKKNQQTIPLTVLRIDNEPIRKRFPKLPSPITVKWKEILLHQEYSFFLPNNHAPYRMWGYVQCDPNEFNKMISNFVWSDAPPDFSPEFIYDEKLNSKKWKTSYDFTKEIKNELLIGNIYINKDESLIYFDIESE